MIISAEKKIDAWWLIKSCIIKEERKIVGERHTVETLYIIQPPEM